MSRVHSIAMDRSSNGKARAKPPATGGDADAVFESAADQLLSDPFYKETLWVLGKEGDFSETLAAIQERHPGVGIGSYPVFLDGRYRCKLVLRARDADALAAAARDIHADLALDTPPTGA